MRVNGCIIALNRFEWLSCKLTEGSSYVCINTSSLLYEMKENKEKRNLIMFKTYVVVLQSFNAVGGIQY